MCSSAVLLTLATSISAHVSRALSSQSNMAFPSSCCLVLVALVALALASVEAQKASQLKTCKRKQPLPQLNQCVKEAINTVIPELVKGMPEYSVPPSIDPLRVIKMEVPRGKGAVSVDLTFKNLNIVGLKDIKVKSLDVNVEKLFLRAKAEIDGTLELIGDYDVNGKVLVLPIQGKGRCNITLVNPKIDISELQAKPLMKKGQKYITVTSLKLTVYKVDRVYYQLENLFNGNKQLGDNMIAVLNDNWQEVFDDMVQPVVKLVAMALRSQIDNLVSRVSYDKIFP